MSSAQSNVEDGSVLEARESQARQTGGYRSAETGSFLWALTIFLSLIYVMAGVPKIGAIEFMAARFEEVWGYPEWFRLLIGGIEFIGGIFLIIPATTFWAATSLGVIMLGAMYTHVALGNPAFTPIPATFFVLLMYVAYKRRPAFLER
mgnify:CR=1 FL=1